MASTRAQAQAPWSASKIQTALRCPREFYYRYIDKVSEAEPSAEARLGKAVHTVLEKVLAGEPMDEACADQRANLSNDNERSRFDALSEGAADFVRRMREFRQRRRVSRQLVEFTFAVRDDFTATQFHAGDALYRGIVDVGYLFDDGKLALVDHKCGEKRRSLTFADQLEGYAVLATAFFRGVRKAWMGVHWVAQREVEWSSPVTPSEVRDRLVPRVLANIEAAALAIDDGPRPQASDWCLLCSYRSVCPAAHDLLLEPVEPEAEPFE